MRYLLPIIAVLIFSQQADAAFSDKEVATVCQQTEADLRDLMEAQNGARTGMTMAEQAGLESELERWKVRYDAIYRSIATISTVYSNFNCGDRR